METLVLSILTGWWSPGSEQQVYTLISKPVKRNLESRDAVLQPRVGANRASAASRVPGSRAWPSSLSKKKPGPREACPLQASPRSCWDSLSPSLA